MRNSWVHNGCILKSMSLKINVRETGDVLILDLNGRITLGEEAASLRDTLKEQIDSGRKNILLNLAEVTYIDSSGSGNSSAASPR